MGAAHPGVDTYMRRFTPLLTMTSHQLYIRVKSINGRPFGATFSSLQVKACFETGKSSLDVNKTNTLM